MDVAGAEGFAPEHRVRKRAEFARCYRRGRRWRGSLVMLVTHRNDAGRARLGITASRKVGGAVVRNRVKRRIREIFRRFSARDRLPALDVVVHVHPRAAHAPFAELSAELERLLSGLVPRSAVS